MTFGLLLAKKKKGLISNEAGFVSEPRKGKEIANLKKINLNWRGCGKM